MANLKHVGASSLSQSGYIGSRSYDLNSKTRGTLATGTTSNPGQWRVMEQTCPAVSAGAAALLGSISGAHFDVQASESTPEQITDYLRECLFERPRQQFSSIAQSLLAAVRYGFAPHEITVHRDAGRVWLSDLAYRPPQTWDLHTLRRLESGWVDGTQRYYDANGSAVMAKFGEPGKAGIGILLWPIYGVESGLLGEGFYRPIYSVYEEWAYAVRLRRVAAERAGLGSLVVTQRETGREPDGDALDDTESALGEMVTTEKSVVILPQWVASAEFAFAKPEAITAITGIIQDCETRILQMFGAQYAARGISTQHGSYSASAVDADELRGARAGFGSWLSRQVQPLIDWLVDINFGPQRRYPELIVEMPKEMTPQEFIAAASQAVGSNLLIIDSSVRNSVRMALRQEPEGDEVESEMERKAERRDAMQIQPAPDKQQAASAAEDDTPDDPDAEDVDRDDSESKDSDVKMTAHDSACCSMSATKPGTRAAPRPGGQDRRTGPNGRDLSAVERLVRWGTIEMALDTGQATIRAALVGGQDDVTTYLLGQLAKREWETGNEAAAALQALAIPPALVKRIKQSVLRELARVADVGAAEAEREYELQQGDIQFAARQQSLWQGDDWSDVTSSQLARETADDAKSQLVRAAISVEAMTRAQVLDLLRKSADELSTKVPDNGATLASTEVFARAREAAVKDIIERTKEQPAAVWYSAILDSNTCTECEQADALYGQDSGNPIPWDSALHAEMMPPYQRCLGGVRCRCQLVYEWPRG